MKTWCLYMLLLASGVHAQDNGNENSIDNEHIIGNPYLLKEWASGIVRFSSGRIMNQFRLRFDCVRNRLLLQFNGTQFAAESKVREFVLYPHGNNKSDSLLFRKGYPPIDKTNEETYYHVLLEGKTTLLRLHGKVIIEDKQILSTLSSKRLEDMDSYYLLKNDTMILLPQDKNALPGIFSQYAAPMHAFIEDQRLKMRSPGDFIKLIGHYNTLLP